MMYTVFSAAIQIGIAVYLWWAIETLWDAWRQDPESNKSKEKEEEASPPRWKSFFKNSDVHDVGRYTLLFLFAAVLFRFIAPETANHFFFKLIYLNIFNLIPLTVGFAFIYGGYLMKKQGRRESMGVLHVLLGCIVFICGPLLFEYMTKWRVYKEYQPATFEGSLNVDAVKARYTPFVVAHQEMFSSFGSSEFTIEIERTNAMNLNNGFGYLSPAIPEEGWFTFSKETDGFALYDDNPGTPNGDRYSRVESPQKYGEGMLIRDAIERQLLWHDFWAEYPEILYLQLNPKDKKDIRAVVPRIKYKISFPFGFVPYLEGAMLFTKEGDFHREMSQAEVMKSELLKNQPIVPAAFVQEVAERQVFAGEGMLGLSIVCHAFRCSNKVEVPTLPGHNQQPYLLRAEDGTQYKVIMTEPDGGSESIFKMFIWNAFTGEFTHIDYGENSGMVGPGAALERMKQVKGYNFAEKGQKSSSKFLAVEPIPLPITVDGEVRIVWKGSIIPSNFSSVSETLLLEADSRALKRLPKRADYYKWASLPVDKKVFWGDNVETSGIAEARELVRQALEILEALE